MGKFRQLTQYFDVIRFKKFLELKVVKQLDRPGYGGDRAGYGGGRTGYYLHIVQI